MEKKFSKAWISSSKRRKQRKYLRQAPLHIKGSFLHAPLSKALKEKLGTRSIRVRKGDSVKVMRGRFKGKEGKVERVDTRRFVLFVEKLDIQKKDGSKASHPIHASKVMIMELTSDDKRRLRRYKKGESK
jgi:large subunit ribosomal protein L24